MPGFNRNIITAGDLANLATAKTAADLPKSFDLSPPAGFSPAALPVAGVATTSGMDGTTTGSEPPGGVAVPSEDDYLTKLLKYVPLEVLGAYLFMAGVVDSNVTKPHDHAVWLGVLLVGFLVITIPYNVRVLNVVRPTQIVVSLVGLLVYVFSIGGWFATTTWYEHWYATLALPVFGLLVAILKLKPLPTIGP